MRVDLDVPIAMDDGLLSYGPCAKGLAFQDGYPSAWQRMIAEHPDVAYGSSNLCQSWEVVDPEKWVPEGYVCVRVDSRGARRSPGYIDHFSRRETNDFYDCIEWAGVSSGKVGLNGGCGPFLHDDPRDRPASVFAGTTTLHLHDSYVLIPVIP